MALVVNDDIVRDEIGGQRTPTAVPLLPSFSFGFIAKGGCPDPQDFDSIEAGTTGVRAHAWQGPGGIISAQLAGSVIHDRMIGVHKKIDITVPVSIERFQPVLARTAAGSMSPAATVLQEILNYGSDTLVATLPALAEQIAMSVAPNPFNPRTSVKLSGLPLERGTVRIFNLRGELVRTLFEGMIESTTMNIVWDGMDDRGLGVSSGVYFVKATAGVQTQTQKVSLIR